MKVLGIGEAVIDNVFTVSDLDHVDIFSSKTIPQKHVGGPVPAALILLSRLGVSCTMLTSVGRDEDAAIIKHILKHEKITVVPKLQRKTKVNTVMVDTITGQRKKIRGNVIHPPIKDIDRKFLRDFDMIIIDRHERPAFYEIIKKKRTSTRILIDPSTEVSPFTLDMIRYADYPIIPIEALTQIGGEKNFHSCLSALFAISKKPLTITAGEFGSILYDGNSATLLPSLQIKPIDVTGAGDIYRGGFAYGILQGWDMAECAQFANLVAGIQCARMGNVAAIPTKEEISLFNNVLVQKKEVSETIITRYFAQLYN